MPSPFYITPAGDSISLRHVVEVTDAEACVWHGKVEAFFLIRCRLDDGSEEEITVVESCPAPTRYPRVRRVLHLLRHNWLWYTICNLVSRRLSATRIRRHAQLAAQEEALAQRHQEVVQFRKESLLQEVTSHRARLIEKLADFYTGEQEERLSTLPAPLQQLLKPFKPSQHWEGGIHERVL